MSFLFSHLELLKYTRTFSVPRATLPAELGSTTSAWRPQRGGGAEGRGEQAQKTSEPLLRACQHPAKYELLNTKLHQTGCFLKQLSSPLKKWKKRSTENAYHFHATSTIFLCVSLLYFESFSENNEKKKKKKRDRIRLRYLYLQHL